jgi:import receptor subunit TOM22
MVKLEEVMDEEFVREQEGPHDEDEWDTDSESDLESESSFAAPDETLYERIVALQDMIPASTRRSIASKYETVSSWTKSGLLFGGKTLWVVSTSALLLGVPWALAYSEEQMIVEQERAELMNQRAQNEVRVL